MRSRQTLPILLLSLSACASQPAVKWVPQNTDLRWLTIAVQYVDTPGMPIADMKAPQVATFRFPLITGALFGFASEGPVFATSVEGRSDFAMDLDSLLSAVAGKARPFSREAIRAGLRIEPRETAVARLGTFAFNPRTEAPLGIQYGFQDPADGAIIVLAYFDRACRIMGAVWSWGGEYVYSVVISGPGFHWITVTESSGGTIWVVSDRNPSKVVFSTTLPD